MSVTKLKFVLQQKDLKKPTLLYKNVLRDKKKRPPYHNHKKILKAI
jgi:hypothetical protein